MSRLRKLDALFAGRVLGLRAYRCDENSPFPQPRKFDWVVSDAHTELPHYTRSLDAAWEGMQKIHLDYSEIRKLWDDTSDGSRPYGALIEGAKGSGFAKADHPAEALVLACLLAIGVSEEELT